MRETSPLLDPDFEQDRCAVESSDGAELPPHCPGRLVRAARFLAWDGGLPLVVAVIPFVLEACGWQLIAVFASFVVPLFAAFARCEVGLKQIKTRVRNPPPIGRQVLLAAAIVVLLVFEVAVSFSLLHGKAPIELWRFAVCLYVVYLAMIWTALRSTHCNAACG